jgi:hypothetical protein
MPDSSETARSYRQYAAKCLEISQNIVDTDRRLFLLKMAQDWLKLAEQVEREAPWAAACRELFWEFQSKKPRADG